MLHGTLATTVVAYYENSPDPLARDYCARIRRAGRLRVTDDVVNHADAIQVPEIGDTVDWAKFITELTLPFYTMFVEMTPPAGYMAYQRMGWLIYREGHDLVVRTSAITGYDLVVPMVDVRASSKGIESVRHADIIKFFHFGAREPSEVAFLKRALKLIVALTARGTPAEIGPQTDYSKINKHRVRKGNPPLLDIHPVTWNVKRANQPSNAEQATPSLYKVRAHPVRGHFKLTKNGSFWWGPFYRGVGLRPTNGRDHCVGLMAGQRRRGRPRRQDAQDRYQGEAF